MTRPAASLGRFVLHAFLWLPVCFALWYWTAPYQAKVIGWLAGLLIDQIKFGIVSTLEQQGSQLLFVTSIKVYPAAGQVALLVPEVNPLVYSFGLALFAALMLASRAAWWKIPVGAMLLLLPQSWGVAFDFLAQVGIKFGPDISARTGISRWQLELIAVGYQFGYLILPCLAPIVLWAALCRPFVETIARRNAAVVSAAATHLAEYNTALLKQDATHESQRSPQQSHVQMGRPVPP